MKEKKITLAPLKFQEAISDLLKVKPPLKEAKPKAKARPARKKTTKK